VRNAGTLSEAVLASEFCGRTTRDQTRGAERVLRDTPRGARGQSPVVRDEARHPEG